MGVNRANPEHVVAGSNRNYWWRCRESLDHRWSASPNNRTGRSQGCPFCAGRRLSVTNSLTTLFPQIAKEFDAEANGVPASEVTAGSNRLYRWICSADPEHTWVTSPNNRTSGRRPTGCPFCSGLRVLAKESLAAQRPGLVEEWDYERNGAVASDQIGSGSMYNAHWVCRRDPSHRWRTRVEHRSRDGSGCPYPSCSLTPRSCSEIHLAFELALFFRIDPEEQAVKVLGEKSLRWTSRSPMKR